MFALHLLCFHFLGNQAIQLHPTAPQTHTIFFIPAGMFTKRPHFLHFLEAIYIKRIIQLNTAGIPQATPIPGYGRGRGGKFD